MTYKGLLYGTLLVFSLASCVRDVDFDQASEISLEPVVELNLVYFTLQPSDFVDPVSSLPVETLRDTTEIRFLDDPEINESLVRADFLFRFTNSVERSFDLDFRFISQANDTVYAMSTTVPAGSPDTPVLSEFVEVVLPPEISELTLGNRLIVEVNFPEVDPSLEGLLEVRSKTTYYLEIRDRE